MEQLQQCHQHHHAGFVAVLVLGIVPEHAKFYKQNDTILLLLMTLLELLHVAGEPVVAMLWQG